MKFEPFIARRYLFSGQHKALVSAITIISVVGVAVGVFALIVVLAVMEGFDENLTQKIIGAYAHLELYQARPERPLKVDEVLTKIRAMPEVKAASPVIAQAGLLQIPGQGVKGRSMGLYFQGIDLEEEQKITSLMKRVEGKRLPGPQEMVLGKKAAQQLFPNQSPVGYHVRIFSASGAVQAGPTMAAPIRNFTIAGVFETGFPDADAMMAYMNLESARDLFRIPEGQVDMIHLVLHDANKVNEVQEKIRRLFGGDLYVATWKDRNPILFEALQLEKWAMFIILLLIVMVAAFNIIGTLVMVVMEKTREIGILKSMGATSAAVQRIFLYQGMMIGLTGTVIGGALGLFVCYLLKYHIKIDILSEAYLADRIPLKIDPFINIVIIASSLLICLVASIYPARQAAKLHPVEALRYE